MKKILLICLLIISLSACVTPDIDEAAKETTINFKLNDDRVFVYHDELFKPLKEEVVFDSDIEGDGELILIDTKNNITTTYLTSGINAKVKLDPNSTYKIGLRSYDNDVLIAYDGLIKTDAIDEVREYQLIDNLIVDEYIDKTKLIRFNDELYAYFDNYDIVEYTNLPKVVATINNVISDTFIPMNNLETNIEEYLNLDIGIYDDIDDQIYLIKDEFEPMIFKKIDDIYHLTNTISQIYPPFSIKYLNEDDVERIIDFLNNFNKNNYETINETLDGDVVEIKLKEFKEPIIILGNHISIDDITYIIDDTILNLLENKYFKADKK